MKLNVKDITVNITLLMDGVVGVQSAFCHEVTDPVHVTKPVCDVPLALCFHDSPYSSRRLRQNGSDMVEFIAKGFVKAAIEATIGLQVVGDGAKLGFPDFKLTTAWHIDLLWSAMRRVQWSCQLEDNEKPGLKMRPGYLQLSG
jgi:hypothetical protein